MANTKDKRNSKCNSTSARNSTNASVSMANTWADKDLAKYQADHAESKTASTLDFLSSASTIEDESAIIAGRERGATISQFFDEWWDTAGGKSN